MDDNQLFQLLNRINSVLFILVLVAVGAVLVASLLTVNDWNTFFSDDVVAKTKTVIIK